MKSVKQIEHKGIIEKTYKNKIVVAILAQSACMSCRLKNNCSVSDTEKKTIEIFTVNPENYSAGETVIVYFKQSLGFRALLLGYLLPFIIVISVLLITVSITDNEGVSGLAALVSLIPYYLILHLKRNKIKNTFSFSIKKQILTSFY